jgi:F1F0 ATPase subunit 2
MNELPALALAVLAGLALGACFFGGLWWTVQKAVLSPRPALLFLSSLILRISIALAGFHFVGRADWQRLLACLLGFILARFIILRLTRTPAEPKYTRPGQVSHAP